MESAYIMERSIMEEEKDISILDAKGIYYRQLNRMIRSQINSGSKNIVLENVLGQRYIGGGINSDAKIVIYGVAGQDLGAFMNGLELIVYGNAQDGVANTMNSGKIIVYGKAGEIPGHSMRGGKVFIKGDVEYRAGIHMKEYMDQIPTLVIGGTAKDYCGEYMAGGRVVVLNLNDSPIPVGHSVGTGIHGGVIYIRGNVEEHLLGGGALIANMDNSDIEFLNNIISEYAKDLDINMPDIDYRDFVKITKMGHRPFAKLYTSAMNIKHKKPRHLNMTPPCMFSCPTGIPTPTYIHMIRSGQLEDAQLLMDEFTPFRMSVCGHVCPAPCMDKCSRNVLDGPVEIQEIAKVYYPDFTPLTAKDKRKELISIIGAGPAGLSAAWQLIRRGYQVEVYDGVDDIGGKLKKAIPRERLSNEVLDKDINRLRSLPIIFRLNTFVDAQLFKKVYSKSDAIIVASGAHTPKRIPYKGGERIIPGLEFLLDINNGKAMDLSDKDVVVIGAGNVGMDIACESWRLGAKKVSAIDIQKPLAFGKELEMATNLGTEILWPKKVERLSDKEIYFEDGSIIKADVVLFSIGEIPDTAFISNHVMVDDRGYVLVGDRSFRTSNNKVFACGDIIKPGLITNAVGDGRIASMEVHSFLSKTDFIYPENSLVPKRNISVTYFGDEDSEVDRCISCGTCIFCDKCVYGCPQGAIKRNGEVFTIDPLKCTTCYTCVNICPRGALQNDYFEDFLEADLDTE